VNRQTRSSQAIDRDHQPGNSKSIPRQAALLGLLVDLRDQEVRKIKALIRDESAFDSPGSGDELDQARRHEDLEFQVSLLDLAERRLAAISSALQRLEQGKFGICEECEEQISLARLQTLPTAKYCLDCQKEKETASKHRNSKVAASRSASLFDDNPRQAETGDAETGFEGAGENTATRSFRRRFNR
jgi:DnaK suppressor protein